MTIGGQGKVQLDVILDKLKNTYGVEVNIVPFIVPLIFIFQNSQI